MQQQGLISTYTPATDEQVAKVRQTLTYFASENMDIARVTENADGSVDVFTIGVLSGEGYDIHIAHRTPSF